MFFISESIISGTHIIQNISILKFTCLKAFLGQQHPLSQKRLLSGSFTKLNKSPYTGGPLIRRPLIGRISLQDSFALFSKFFKSSHRTAVLFTVLIRRFVKKMLPFFHPMRGPPVQAFLESSESANIQTQCVFMLHKSISCALRLMKK